MNSHYFSIRPKAWANYVAKIVNYFELSKFYLFLNEYL